MSLLNEILSCLCGNSFDQHTSAVPTSKSDSRKASDIIDCLFTSDKTGKQLQAELKNSVEANGWTEDLAASILNALSDAIEEGRTMSVALKEMSDKVIEAADAVGGFVKDHPVFCTVIALGILVLLMPWVIEALGFAAEGPVAGT
jgi:hypothetical protein